MELLLRPWRLYADSSGRSRRAEFWLFYAVKIGLLFLLPLLADLAHIRRADGWGISDPVMILVLIWLAATFVPSIVLLARRLHDLDVSGKWVWTTFIPYLGFLAVIVIGLIPGTRGENEKGDDPRGLDPNAMAEVFE